MKAVGTALFIFGVTIAAVSAIAIFFVFTQSPQALGVGVAIEVPCAGPDCAPEQVPLPWPGPAETRAAVVIEGFGPSGALVFVLKDGAVTRTGGIPSSGIFSISLTGLSPGNTTIGIFASDSDGLTTPTVSVDVVLYPGNITRIFDILLPPTIRVGEANLVEALLGQGKETVVREGERVVISGSTYPRAKVRITRFPDRQGQEVLADGRGRFEAVFPTDNLAGPYTVSARSSLASGLISELSNAVSFGVIPRAGQGPQPPRGPGEAPPARPEGPPPANIDMNGDHLVNILDFSILLYNWGTPQDPRADFNGDGIVNIIDLSVLLFWWTG